MDLIFMIEDVYTHIYLTGAFEGTLEIICGCNNKFVFKSYKFKILNKHI